MQFLGSIDAKVDAKMRVFIPANFRKVLQGAGQSVLILRKDVFQECLVLYPESVWIAEVDKLRTRLSRWDKGQQQLFRQFVMDTERLELDANGRVLIPKRCMQMINAGLEIQFLGVDNTIEVWSKDNLSNSMLAPDDFAEGIQRIMNRE